MSKMASVVEVRALLRQSRVEAVEFAIRSLQFNGRLAKQLAIRDKLLQKGRGAGLSSEEDVELLRVTRSTDELLDFEEELGLK